MKIRQREPSCSMRTDGQRDMTKLTIAIRNFARLKQADITFRLPVADRRFEHTSFHNTMNEKHLTRFRTVSC